MTRTPSVEVLHATSPAIVADPSSNFSLRLNEVLESRRLARRFRERRTVRVIDATHIEIDGRRLINFAGNDYLGLAHHPALNSQMKNTDGSGAGASALVSGHTTAHAQAEAAIARWKGSENAVLLPSGYQANHAAIQTCAALGGNRPESVRFLIDKLAHASLIDAVRGTDCPFRIVPHNNIEKLTRLLQTALPDQLQIIITESIFSMDGDACPLAELVKLRDRFRCVLLLDEAHGSGVYGPTGCGFAGELGLNAFVDVSICTFSKAAGLSGGAICGSKLFCDAVVNFGRAYIYSTAISPHLAHLIETSIGLMVSESWRRKRLRECAIRFRKDLTASGWSLPAGDSPIIPLIMGEESAALNAAMQLESDGMLAVAIRPPTVGPKSSRIRVTLSAMHSDEEVERLVKAINRLR